MSQSPQHRRKSNRTAALFSEIDELLAKPHPPYHPRDVDASPEPEFHDHEPMVGKKSGRALLREEGTGVRSP
jgi:hypothetical protein